MNTKYHCWREFRIKEQHVCFNKIDQNTKRTKRLNCIYALKSKNMSLNFYKCMFRNSYLVRVMPTFSIKLQRTTTKLDTVDRGDKQTYITINFSY